MIKNYILYFLDKPVLADEETAYIGCIAEKKTKAPVLLLYVIKDYTKNYHQTCCFVGESKDPTNKNKSYGIVYIDPGFYVLFLKKDIRFAEVCLIHELGHYLNKDHKKPNWENYSKERKESFEVKNEEIAADNLAVSECGIENFLYYIDVSIERRKKMTNDKNKSVALNEFSIRRQKALDSIRN